GHPINPVTRIWIGGGRPREIGEISTGPRQPIREADISKDGDRGPCAGLPSVSRKCCYSAARLLRVAAFSRSISAGVSCGRSILSVSLLSLPVKRKGTW